MFRAVIFVMRGELTVHILYMPDFVVIIQVTSSKIM